MKGDYSPKMVYAFPPRRECTNYRKPVGICPRCGRLVAKQIVSGKPGRHNRPGTRERCVEPEVFKK